MDKISYHAGLTNAVEVKRNMLEASRDTLRLMQAVEILNAIRAEKVNMAIKLNKTMQEISLILQRLKEELPRADITAVTPQNEQRVELKIPILQKDVKAEIRPVAPAQDLSADELKSLEKQLSDIESRLNSLK